MTASFTEAKYRSLFKDILKGVSRSFYLTLAVLPSDVKYQIALAYLLARAADTVADTEALPPAERSDYLNQLRQGLTTTTSAHAFSELKEKVSSGLKNRDELRLLQRLEELYILFDAMEEQDQKLVRNVVMTLTDGMLFDLNTFPSEASSECQALERFEELDRYTYLVAGCVGEFWTKISASHISGLSDTNIEAQSSHGIGLGKALQMTNIIRDLPRDLRIGRCYIPQAMLSEHQVTIEDLYNAHNSSKSAALLKDLLKHAAKLYQHGEYYLMAIPRTSLRMRLAAAWPMLIGLETLVRLAQERERWLDNDYIIKVDRRWVYKMLLISPLVVCSNYLLRRCISRLQLSLGTALSQQRSK